MSQINALGIGAGRSIASSADDEEERLRQRRLRDAQRLQRAVSERSLQDRLDRAQQQALQAAHNEHAAQARSQVTAKAEARAAASAQRMPSLQTDADGAGVETRAETAMLETGEQNALPSAHQLSETEQPAAADPAAGQDSGASDLSPQIIGLSKHQLAELLDQLPALLRAPGVQDLEQSLHRFHQSLQASALSGRRRPDAEALDEMGASLDFMQGYLDVSPMQSDRRELLMCMIDSLRQELAGLSAPVASAAQTLPLGTEKSRDIQRTAIADARTRRLSRRVSPDASDSPPEESGQTDDRATTDAVIAASASSAVLPVDAAKTSLSKDADKRRDETPVVVTVRSV